MSSDELTRTDFLYQPYYCEENIWHLCQNKQLKNSHVIFIASRGDSFPMLNQRVMKDPLIPILWDYHVILLVHSETNQILDFDTTLPFGVDVDTYFRHSFLDSALLGSDEAPLFKVITASKFTATFSSDRSHMKTESGWLAPQPDWPRIANFTSNFSSFIDMTNSDIGEVLTYDEVLARFS